MKKLVSIFLIMILALFLASPASALIMTSASGAMNSADYGYTFVISETDDANIFTASLTNTSDDALIDRLLFNMDAELGTDFNISVMSPDWTFKSPESKSSIQFDYYGDANGDRIAPGGFLVFEFIFNTSFVFPDDPFAIWTGTSGVLGVGTGGGEDFGQVAVSFQGIGGDEYSEDDSDLLASNWSAQPVPEPSTIVLLGLGLVGLAGVGRKKIKG